MSILLKDDSLLGRESIRLNFLTTLRLIRITPVDDSTMFARWWRPAIMAFTDDSVEPLYAIDFNISSFQSIAGISPLSVKIFILCLLLGILAVCLLPLDSVEVRMLPCGVGRLQNAVTPSPSMT